MTPSPPPDRRAIGILGAYIEGWRRVLKAPAVWAGLLVVSAIQVMTPTVGGWTQPAGAAFSYGTSLSLAFVSRAHLLGDLLACLQYAIVRFIDPSTSLVDLVQRGMLNRTQVAVLVGQSGLWWF